MLLPAGYSLLPDKMPSPGLFHVLQPHERLLWYPGSQSIQVEAKVSFYCQFLSREPHSNFSQVLCTSWHFLEKQFFLFIFIIGSQQILQKDEPGDKSETLTPGCTPKWSPYAKLLRVLWGKAWWTCCPVSMEWDHSQEVPRNLIQTDSSLFLGSVGHGFK